MKSSIIRTSIAVLALMSFMALAATSGAAAHKSHTHLRLVRASSKSAVTTTNMGPYTPTFVGTAATGCGGINCSLLTGPVNTPSVASLAHAHSRGSAGADRARPLVAPMPRYPALSKAARRRLSHSPSFPVPAVSCDPLGTGCDQISTSAGGAVGVKGLNAVDSAQNTTNIYKDVEPPDQGLCAGNGYAVEANNIGEIQVFNTSLSMKSSPISLDTIMGLASQGSGGWSSGGDPSCEYDPSGGGHWFFTEIVSANPESAGGAFTGCFAGVANDCYEGIAVTDGANPYGPYHVYFLHADYNPNEPGYPSLLNDFAKISVTRDAFMLFYDEFPLLGGGFGNGIFNGAQEFAFNKSALESGDSVLLSNGNPNPAFTVAIENMGLLNTPDGTCAKDKILHMGGITCWVAVIPAQPADSGQFDNNNGGTGFMFGTLDFYGFYGPLPTSGDNRVAAWAWTGLHALDSSGCSACSSKIKFSGTLFRGADQYYEPEGLAAPQKAGPTPLGDQCETAGLATVQPCPEGGIATNGDFTTQVSQAQGQLWTSTSTEVAQDYQGANAEIHQGAIYWVIGTNSFDTSGTFSLTNQGYVTPEHEDLSMPAIAAEGTGGSNKAIMLFTLTGNGGPTGADNGGFYPSTAYGRMTATSPGLLTSTVNVADMGQSPQDGFSEYQGYPGATRPRWGDYSWGIYLPNSGGRIYFANEYIQYPNCEPPAFQLNTIATCGGTRDSNANWGTSVNYVVP